jgi:hypothetical protein
MASRGPVRTSGHHHAPRAGFAGVPCVGLDKGHDPGCLELRDRRLEAEAHEAVGGAALVEGHRVRLSDDDHLLVTAVHEVAGRGTAEAPAVAPGEMGQAVGHDLGLERHGPDDPPSVWHRCRGRGGSPAQPRSPPAGR